MAKELRLRRGTTAQHSTFTGANGEVTVDTTKKTVVVHDGATAGGVPLATEAAVNAKQNADAELTTLAGMSADRATFLAGTQGFGFRNRIINGDMRIDQRNNGGSVNSSGGGTFSVDRFTSFGAGGGVYTTQRSTDVPTGQGFVNSIVSTVTTTDSPTGTDYYLLTQAIEGFNIADLGWGTASARSVTISFWVKASLTGTYTVALRNSALNRSYRATYTINSANTWEQKTITVAGDTTGTWLTDNGAGIRLGFTLGAGSDFIDTGNVWSALEDFAATGQTQWIATSGATFFLTGVQLEAGSVATPFERRDYGRELIMCQRYFQRLVASETYSVATGMSVGANNPWYQISFPVQMRAAPTCAFLGAAVDYWVQWSAGTSTPSSIPTWTALSGKGGYFQIPGSYGMSAGTATIFLLNNSTSAGGMLWSAEL